MELTQEWITQFNNKCAEFLGLDIIPTYSNEPRYRYIDGYEYYLHKLRFQFDWNWIMKVVEKIEELGYQFDINGNEAGINSNIISTRNIATGGTMNSYNEKYFPTLISVAEEDYSKKAAVVEAIHQFIDWYNKQK